MNFRLDTALQLRARKLAEMRAIIDTAETRDGKLSRSENTRVKSIESEIEKVDEQIREYNASIGLDEDADTMTRGAALARRNGFATAESESDVLRSTDSMADWTRKRSGYFGVTGDGLENEADVENLSLGAVVRAMATGKRDGLSDVARRSLLESVDSQGGYTTPEILGARLIDRVRNVGRVFQAGATTVPLLSDRHSIARLDTGVTPAFRNEGDPIAASGMTFSRVTFVPKFLGVLVKVSLELLEDMTPEAHNAIENEIAKAIALAVDSASLYGDGTSANVLGIKGQSGVTLTAFGGANGTTPANYDFLLDGIQTLAAANFAANGMILAPRTVRTLNGLKDSQNRYIDAPQSIKDVPQYVTNQAPTNLTVGTSAGVCSDVFIGEWENLMIGFRPSVQLRTVSLNERYLPDEGMIGLVAYTRFDVQLAHGAAFNVISGVKP